MRASNNLLKGKVEYKVKKGDCLVSEDGYVFMIVQDKKDYSYRLLRLIDGEPSLRSASIENELTSGSYSTIEELMDIDDRKSHRVIPADKLVLDIK